MQAEQAMETRADGGDVTARVRNLATRMLSLQLERVFELARCRMEGADREGQEALDRNRAARLALVEEARAAGHVIPAIAALERFGLSPFELDLLHLAIGAQLDPRLRDVVRRAGGDEPVLTFGTALRLLTSSIEASVDLAESLGPASRLIECGLLRPPIQAGLQSELVATRRVIAALSGRPLPARLPPWARLYDSGRTDLPTEMDPARVAGAIAGHGGGFALISGAAGTGKSAFARMVAGAISERHLEVDVPRASRALPLHALGGELVELIEDASLLGIPVILDDASAALAPAVAGRAVADALVRTHACGLVVVDDERALAPTLLDRASLRVTLRGLRGEAARLAWGLHLGVSSQVAHGLGDDIELTPSRIARAARLVERLDISPVAAVVALAGEGSNLVQPARVAMTLDHIVLPAETRDELLEVIAAIRARPTVLDEWGMARRLSRGHGISALFDGEPGTGKTVAAEVVAHEVGLPLQRVNASALVDKYIGETEKNLSRVFAQARGGNYVLLFDEADALFGTRTDVRGANDRYANLEVNVLLQLMEEHSGVVILTTNLTKNIDQAFLRRINYKVRFELPDEEQREKLWDGLLPAYERSPDVDLAELARAFPMSGGDIKSAVLRAAYRAAGQGRKLGMNDLVDCAQLECQAMGRVVAWGGSRLQGR